MVLDPAESSSNTHTSTRVLEGTAAVVASQISNVWKRMGGVIAPEKRTVIDLTEQLCPMIVTYGRLYKETAELSVIFIFTPMFSIASTLNVSWLLISGLWR